MRQTGKANVMNLQKNTFYIIVSQSNAKICETIEDALLETKDPIFKNHQCTIYKKCGFTGKYAEYVCDLNFDEEADKDKYSNFKLKTITPFSMPF